MISTPEDSYTFPFVPFPEPTTKPFRFKKRSASPSTSHHSSHRHHHHRHHHRSRRRPHNPVDEPTLYDDTCLPNSRSSQYLNPDDAFRESLFDALADDEGAAFWEGVYGQPIHTYSPYTTTQVSDDDDPDNPKLERMTDEEYVAYVRGKMWEKSHQYILEERRKRDEDKKKRKKRDEEGRRLQASVDEALRRREERRKREESKSAWRRYTKKWDTTFSTAESRTNRSMEDRLPWPVESGLWKDVCKEEVEGFFRRGAGVEGIELGETLKKERVRWHPDKMMQRAGGRGFSEGTMKVVTAVFQVVDQLWGEARETGKV